MLNAPARFSASTSVDPANPRHLRMTFLPYASLSVSRRDSSRMVEASCDRTVPSPAFWRRRERLTHQEETVMRRKMTMRLSKRAAPRWRAPFAAKWPGTASCQTRIAPGTAGGPPPRSFGSSAMSPSSSSSSRPSNQAFYFDYRRRWCLAFSHLTLLLCSYRWAWDSYRRCRCPRLRRHLSATSASSLVPKVPDAGRPPRWPLPRKTSLIPARYRSCCWSRPRRRRPPSRTRLLARQIPPSGIGDRVARPVCTVASASFSFFACGIWICPCHLSLGLAVWDRSLVAPRRFRYCADGDDRDDCDVGDARCARLPSSASAESRFGQLEPPGSAHERKLTVYPGCGLWLALFSVDRDDSSRGIVSSLPSTSAPSCTCCNCAAPGSRWRHSLPCTRAVTERKRNFLCIYIYFSISALISIIWSTLFAFLCTKISSVDNNENNVWKK